MEKFVQRKKGMFKEKKKLSKTEGQYGKCRVSGKE